MIVCAFIAPHDARLDPPLPACVPLFLEAEKWPAVAGGDSRCRVAVGLWLSIGIGDSDLFAVVC